MQMSSSRRRLGWLVVFELPSTDTPDLACQLGPGRGFFGLYCLSKVESYSRDIPMLNEQVVPTDLGTFISHPALQPPWRTDHNVERLFARRILWTNYDLYQDARVLGVLWRKGIEIRVWAMESPNCPSHDRSVLVTCPSPS